MIVPPRSRRKEQDTPGPHAAAACGRRHLPLRPHASPPSPASACRGAMPTMPRTTASRAAVAAWALLLTAACVAPCCRASAPPPPSARLASASAPAISSPPFGARCCATPPSRCTARSKTLGGCCSVAAPHAPPGARAAPLNPAALCILLTGLQLLQLSHARVCCWLPPAAPFFRLSLPYPTKLAVKLSRWGPSHPPKPHTRTYKANTCTRTPHQPPPSTSPLQTSSPS
jgi:hypothetical protein